ncbi:1-phosphatidylinositol-3-phosphate 5-kinase [Entomortierella parvispora]|uniref:1-phosphatidylinositol-3-phosphate 5-kinase n=1 Tax=Entomortierella parvispora TaxID=205924 RepID=A0A9P3HKY9_9FUNG|nr:1-phosphatidylinositol-3-phosphate 5-kinase [Entomortierella parvispora]
MVASKPLPPIPPAPISEKGDKDEKHDRPERGDRRSHIFSTVSNLKRKLELPLAALTTSSSASQLQPQPHVDLSSSRNSSCSNVLAASSSTAMIPGQYPPSRPRSPLPAFTSGTTAPATVVPGFEPRPEVKHNPHYVPLDQRSIQHLRAIARQSIASSCLEPELLWLRLFMEMIQKLAANVSDAWQQIEASYEAASDGEHRGNNEKKESGAPGPVSKREKLGKNTDPTEEQAKGTLNSKPVFTYNILLRKLVGSSQECSFTEGKFEGESILREERSYNERRRAAPKENRIKIPLGGTISLVGGAEDLPKAEKILEIIVFALCSLQLEAYLMRDHDVVRSEPILVIQTGAESEFRIAKPPVAILPQPQARSTALDNSKRASKGSMFFGWLTRGTVPAKYKKGTTQLVQDADQKPEHARAENGSGQSTVASSIAEDLGIGEDLHNIQGSRFGKMIQQIEKAIISVSPDIHFPPPHLLLRLREEEVLGTDARRKSYTWEDVEFVAKKIGFGNRMTRSGTAGALQSRFGTSVVTQNGRGFGKVNRLPIDSRAGLDHLMTNSNAVQGIFNHQSISFSYSRYWSATAAAPCNPPDMITVEYYRKEGQYEDMGLGEMIEFICRGANAGCSDKTCGHKRLEHISTYTHGEARINITVEQPRPDSTTDFASEEFTPFLASNRKIGAWTRCKMCRSRTKPRVLSKASRLYSFGKYLELLLYGQNFEPGQRPLCEHTKSKDTIARCFLYGGLVVTFEYESIDLFEMRISRLQVHEDFPAMPKFISGPMDDEDHEYAASTMGSTPQLLMSAIDISVCQNSDYITETDRSRLVNKTRLEIMHFYESCKKIIVSMEELLGETRSSSKQSISKNPQVQPTVTVQDPAAKAALDRLDELGDRWKEDEFSLYDQLKQHPISRLNDIRNRLREYIKRTMRSMEMWQKEHWPQALQAGTSKNGVAWALPEYAKSETLHTFPGSCVIVREDEPSSIIACALSSTDYLCLLSSILSSDECQSEANEKPPQPPQKDIPHSDSTIGVVPPLRTSRSASSVTLARRKSSSRGSEGSATVTGSADGSPPGKVRGVSDNEDGAEDDDDSFLVVDGYQTSVKFLEESKVDFSSLLPGGTLSTRSTIGLHFGSSRHSKNTTLSSMIGAAADRHKSNHAFPEASRPMSMMAFPSSTPALVASPLSTPSESMVTNSFFLAPPPDSRSTTPTPGGKPSKHSFGYNALTSGLSGTMKGLSLNALSEKIGSGFSSYGASSANIEKADKEFFKTEGQEHTMRETLALENESMSRSPHMKARFSHGNTSFSCTVYYAAEFDTLRRRCGIHQNYVRSLSRCKSWNANGGKSKSSFYKTRDDRFVVKQMVSSWNIAEKDELLKFAPKYFEYMERSHAAPTVLAKIFGFYTFKIKNGSTGQILKIDVLVMEHLFYNQKITRTFDLKGIQDRHAGSKVSTNNRAKGNNGGSGSTTLWDGDFIEGRYKALLLIHSHSKKIIRESLLNDTEFLSGANIMDYSLLVGVDDERKELVVGIVDFIGAYTWYKRIESKGKTTLRGAKDNVTVLPPQQYMTRFQQAMEQYFIAVPDKWSKTVVEQKREANKEATRTNIPSTIPEGSKESTDVTTPDLEKSLKNKTSGYLEKMSKAFILQSSTSKQPQPDAASAPAPTTIGAKTAEGGKSDSGAVSESNLLLRRHNTDTDDDTFDEGQRGQRLPRVFYPLD